MTVGTLDKHLSTNTIAYESVVSGDCKFPSLFVGRLFVCVFYGPSGSAPCYCLNMTFGVLDSVTQKRKMPLGRGSADVPQTFSKCFLKMCANVLSGMEIILNSDILTAKFTVRKCISFTSPLLSLIHI